MKKQYFVIVVGKLIFINPFRKEPTGKATLTMWNYLNSLIGWGFTQEVALTEENGTK